MNTCPTTTAAKAARKKGAWKEGCFISHSAGKVPEKARLTLALLFRFAELGWKGRVPTMLCAFRERCVLVQPYLPQLATRETRNIGLSVRSLLFKGPHMVKRQSESLRGCWRP
jgi:hypothetical protein